ncbi:NAD(P)-dependent dehydrogenase, short-chain alcohol dehydrogenase family [Dyella jiangningensis]|uniref:SDR family NAD(P)-dependent oxidoreductase n=1 Tax=Dyella sp. AtDHG13 TaxID=1938897 RepID=UPI00088154A2|nr:SDR family NAD(P)-dependent oxidoreductase [Dyella sp. AtDHG13]PXV60396.1 NAD(P)-dependent dehydrogenase (short-subunit alcohol dehydrogenase family) [Dyella sp. AtDHG13]SDJ43806.1 NAD(P)-dependent dehydrogenase, short-chain alcohol dehydrogenase family [Dyella jiangningensis]
MTSNEQQKQQTALIVGASRGLGCALAEEYLKRGWQVIATVRGSTHTPLHDLQASAGDRLEIERLDIDVPSDIKALRQRLEGRSIDVLFVNAGISIEPDKTAAEMDTEGFLRMMVTNALSPMRVIEALDTLVAPGGVIAAMSSGLGSVANNQDGGWEGYRASKAALNTLMRSYAARQPVPTRTLLLIAPGWVRTDMGGDAAPLDISDSIPRVVDVVTSQTGCSGLQYLNRLGETVPW